MIGLEKAFGRKVWRPKLRQLNQLQKHSTEEKS
jgi:hypothetical protein